MVKLDSDDKLSKVSGGYADGSSGVFSIDGKVADLLYKKGYLDSNGCILKKDLKKAQEFLQGECGVNVTLYNEHDKKKIENLSKKIKLNIFGR